jgi:hypothetical protein
MEAREKHEGEIDMAETRERLYELFQHLSRTENDCEGMRCAESSNMVNMLMLPQSTGLDPSRALTKI